MSEDNQSRVSMPDASPETSVSSEAIAGQSSGRRRRKARKLVDKVTGMTKKIFHSKDSCNCGPVVPNTDNESSSSSPNVEVQVAPVGVEQRADPQSALRDAHDDVAQMGTLTSIVTSVASAADDAPAALDTAVNIEDTYLKPLRIFDTIIGKIADVHPYAKMALGVLSCAAKIILAQADRDEAVLSLLKKLGEVYGFMTQDEMLGQISSMSTILGQISQQTLECAQFIKDYSDKKNFWKRLGKNVGSETDDTIQRYSAVLDALMQNFRDQVTRDVAVYVHRTGEILELSGITCAAGAGVDTRKRCLPDTRTDILSQVMGWINDTGDDVPRVLWLSGPAGTGKSAIAHTVASSFIGVGGLGSCYCFDRYRDADHRHEKVFSTIAHNLAGRNPEMRRALADAVQNDSALKTTVDIIQQWQKLLVEPLGKLSESSVGPIVIVIDALDESGAAKTRSDLLRILAGKSQDLGVSKITTLPKNFRIVVTSRPLPDIEAELASAPHIRRMSMDDIPPTTAERDIHAYISKMLEGLSDFGDKEFEALAKKADGLFEWARLACEYIKTPPAGFSQREYFDAVMSRDPATRENLLYDMYDLILTEIMPKDKHRNVKSQQTQLARFRSVMGQILGAAEPLPLDSLNAMRKHFPDRNEQYKVEVILKDMGSLLSGAGNPSTPIRPLHASFRDFLTEHEHSGEFFVDMSKMQGNLAFASLRVMERGLSFNICDLKSSYLPNSEDPELQERVEKRILPHLSYACRFWAAHVQAAVFDTELAKEVKLFFDHERLLFWIEVLGLIHALSGAIPALPLIAKWLKGDAGYKDVSSTAVDVQRFIQVFIGMILHSTPHLYVSALPFSPLNSVLSTKFAAKFPNSLRLAAGRDLNWPAVQTVLRGHTGSVMSVSLSQDGTRIVTGSSDKTVRLWDAATGQPVSESLVGHTSSVTSVSLSPDGTRIVSGSEDKTIRLWEVTTGKPVGEPLQGHTEPITSVSFSPDGTCIISGSRDNTVRLWDAVTVQPLSEPLLGHTDSVYSVSFSPDGTRIVSGSEDETIRLWEAATGQPVGEPLRGHTSTITSVSFSPDGTCIISGSWDRTVRLWDAVTVQPVGEPLLGHIGWVQSVSFSPDGTRIVSGSDDNSVRLWDVATRQPVGEPLLGHTAYVNSVSFSPDGTRIVSGSDDSTIRLWDAATGQPVSELLRENTSVVCSMSLSPDPTRIVTGCLDGTVRLWDTATGQPVGKPLRGHTDPVLSVSFSPDGTRIVSGSYDKTVRLWDVATGQPVCQPLRGHRNPVLFSPDGTRMVTGSDDNTMQLWDAVTQQPVGEPLQGHTELITSVSFSPDGSCIISGSWDRTVRLWDAVMGQPFGQPLLGHTDWVQSVSFSPDGTRIVSGSDNGSVRLWDVATGQPVGQPLLGHTDSVNSVSFSPDGTRIVSGSDDSTVRLWDVITGQLVSEPLRWHTSNVRSVSFSLDGTCIVSSSLDGIVHIWYAVVGKPLQECTDKDTAHPTAAGTTMTTTTSNSDFIRFSSSSTHVLSDTAQLLEGTSHDDRWSTPFVLGDDGWMLGPKRRLLFWVPPASRQPFYTSWSALVIPRGGVELDLSHMAHGTRWQHCRDEHRPR